MTPRETTVVSSTTTTTTSSAFSSSCLTSSNNAATLPSLCRDRSSSLIKVDLQLATTAAGSCPMPNNGGSSGKRSAATAVPATSLLAIQTKNQKKRRRVGVVCRTHSPTASPHNSPKVFKPVKRIPPTLPGVQKAAQVLNDSGIVVFPTERTYEACVRWSQEPWERQVSSFFTVAFRNLEAPSSPITTTPLASSGYHVYVPKQKVGQLDKLLGFPKKAYALKPPSNATSSPTASPSSSTTFPSTITPTCQKVYYFSETRWVLHRLAQRYWPGPVKIYVPVRTSPSSTSTTLPCELLQPLPCTTTTNQSLSHNSTNTINATSTAAAIAALCSQESMAASENSVAPSTPTTASNATAEGGGLHYLGLRCPSHPLTARILQEASVCTTVSPPDGLAATQEANQAINSHSWWLGLPVQGSSETSSSFLTTAQEVAQNVLSRTANLSLVGATSPTPNNCDDTNNNNGAAPPTAATVHVVNGEDKRELFTVPTCQHSSSISLWIDDTARTIHVFGKESNPTLPFSVQQIERLLQDGDIPVSGNYVPDIAGMLTLVEKAHLSLCPDVPFCGWDVVLSADQDEDQEGRAFLRGGSCSTDSPILGPRVVQSPGELQPNMDADGRQRVIRAVLRKWKVIHHVEG